MRTSSPITRAPIRIGDSGGVYLAAFSSKLPMTRSIRTASHSTSGRSGGMPTVILRCASTAFAELIALPTISSIDCHSTRSRIAPLWMRAMSSRLVTMSLIRVASSRMAAAISVCCELNAGRLRRMVSASPTSAASGVRRSCDSAASSELRRRSDSICTVACCATST